MDSILTRFYAIMGCYLDDDRVAAQAIAHFKEVDCNAEAIYKDLISCRYSAWIDYLENIAEEMKYQDLKEWCVQKQFELDMMRSKFWSTGDNRMIELGE